MRYCREMAKRSHKTSTASQKFEQEARHWKETGEIGWSGLNEYGYTKLRFWLGSEGAHGDRVSDLLWEYGEMVEQRLIAAKPRGWFGAFMGTRDYCSICGESFMLSNLSFCTHCDCLFGYCHQFSGGTAANGNPQCPICKTGELVWGTTGDGTPNVQFRVKRVTAEDLLGPDWSKGE